jgi:predicted transposase/invertase (TIGR01784 family)
MKKTDKAASGAVRINRKNDYAFKRIFGHEDTKDVLAAFLTAVLGIRIEPEELTLVNTEMSPEYLADKSSTLDIHIRRSEAHEKMNVEMQVSDEQNITSRLPFYWGKGYTEDLKEGENYKSLPRMINIAVVDFDIFTWENPEKFHSVFHIREDDEGVMFTDKLEFHILELPKLKRIPLEKRQRKDWSPVECWGLYLDNLEEGDIMEQIMEREPMIKRALTVEDVFAKNARERELYEMREKGRRDFVSAIVTAKEEGEARGEVRGRARGRAEGKAETTANIAANMLRWSMDENTVSRMTGLPLEELAKLKVSLQPAKVKKAAKKR